MSDVSTQEAPATQTATGSNPKGDFIWYELMTPDPDGAKAFYDSVVGWKIGDGIAEYQGYRMIVRSDGGNAGGVLPITPEMAERGARPVWLGYINVDDVDHAVADIEAAGGSVIVPPMGIPNVGTTALVRDPQGAAFYVMKPIPPAGNPNAKSDVFAPNELGRCAWNELATSDQKAALDFYTSQFGWKKGDSMPMGDMGEYQFIMQGDVMLGAIMTKSPENAVRWRYYFRVANIDDAKSAAERSGGTIIHGPVEVPGGDRILIGKDPQGAEFALVGK
jgi:predicted enzyme related to lactoylglutathione lyase